MTFHVTDVTFTAANQVDERSGLLGYLSCTINQLRLDGIALRRTREGRLALSYPARRDRSGHDHPYMRPLDEATRQAIEEQILQTIFKNSSGTNHE